MNNKKLIYIFLVLFLMSFSLYAGGFQSDNFTANYGISAATGSFSGAVVSASTMTAYAVSATSGTFTKLSITGQAAGGAWFLRDQYFILQQQRLRRDIWNATALLYRERLMRICMRLWERLMVQAMVRQRLTYRICEESLCEDMITAEVSTAQEFLQARRRMRFRGIGTISDIGVVITGGSYSAGMADWGNSGNTIKNNDVQDAVTDGTNGTPRTSSETRPRNVALLPCIKY